LIKLRSNVRKIAVRAAAIAAAVASVAAVSASSAVAYSDWECPNYTSAQTCWAGTGYQPYQAVLNQLWVQRYAVCAKGQTAAGNTREGAGNGCAYNTTWRNSCFGSTSPSTALYVYWAGSGDPAKDIGSAYLGSDNPPTCSGA
jgi:hypothetical protein